VVGGQRGSPPDHVPDGGNIFAEVAEPLLRGHTAFVDRSRPVSHELGVQVHFEERQAHLLALAHALRIDLGILVIGRVGIDSDAFAHLWPEQAVGGYVVYLASNIVERHVHRTVSAAHASVIGELPDAPQVAFDIQRIAAHQVRFQDESDSFDARIPHLAQPVDVLVRVDADDGVIVVGRHAAGAHVRNLQTAGGRAPIDRAVRVALGRRRFQQRPRHRANLGGAPE